MSTLLFLLTLMLPMEDSEQLQTSVRVEPPRGKEVKIAVTCDFYPKTLSVGDVLYVQTITKNITQEPLEYFYRKWYPSLANDSRFATYNALVQRNGLSGFGSGISDSMQIETEDGYGMYTPSPPMIYPHKNTLQPGDVITTQFPPCFIPKAREYDKPVWVWDDKTKWEIMLLGFRTWLEGTDGSSRTRTEIHISQELKIKQRPQEELQLIREWSGETANFDSRLLFVNNRHTKQFTAEHWREFEEKLTPGTLRNFIRVQRTLVEISQDENKGKRQAMLDEMLVWINELHQLEKEGLTKRAYELITPVVRVRIFENEIAVPEK